MFACVCNAIRESQVTRVIREEGAGSTGEIFQALAAKPCCGRCTRGLERMLRAEGAGCCGQELLTA